MDKVEYSRGLRRLKREQPDHKLLPTLEAGYSVVNAVYLRAALKPAPPVAQQAAPKAQKAEAKSDNTDEPQSDPVLRDLWATRGRLFRESGKTSNKFHACKTDDERKAVSEQLLQIWGEILQVKAQIEHYRQYGQVMASEEQFPLPDDPIKLMKKLHAIRQAISEQRAKIQRLAEQPDSPDKAEQIRKAEEKLNHLILYRGHAEQKSQRFEADVHE